MIWPTRTFFVLLSGFLFWVGGPSPVIAEETPSASPELSLAELLNVMVQVGSQKEETVFTSPSTVTVIDRKMIAQYNFQSVSEAINTVSGVKALRSYLRHNIATSRWILNEHYSNKVLILINGVSTWLATTGEGNLDRVSIHDVERIEILKGPASVLYGTNAFTGAINLVLKKPRSEGIDMEASLGSERTYKAGASYQYAKNDWEVFLSAHSQSSDGHAWVFEDEEYVKGNYTKGKKGYVRDKVDPSTFNLNAKHKGHAFLFNAFKVSETELGTNPSFGVTALGHEGGAGHQLYHYGYLLSYENVHLLPQNINLRSGFFYDWGQTNFSRSDDDSLRTRQTGERYGAFARTVIPMGEQWEFELGLDMEERRSKEYNVYQTADMAETADNNMKGRELLEGSIFGQVGYHIKPVKFLVGSRFTYNELFKENFSSRGTAVYSIDDRSSLKLIYGQSYRAPSIFELYFVTPAQTVKGTKTLKPETSDSLELAYLKEFGNFYIQGLGYHTWFKNKIQRVRQGAIAVYTNGSSFKAHGVELELKYNNPELLSAFLNYNIVWGNKGDAVTDSGVEKYNFKYVPRHTASLGLTKDIGSFFGSALANFWDERNGSLRKIPSVYTLDFNAGFKWGKMTHQLSVKNIFNQAVDFAEFSRLTLNSLPDGGGRILLYSFTHEL